MFVTKVFFELMIEIFDGLIKCPMDGILLPYERGVLQGMPEISYAVFTVFVFDEVKYGMTEIVVWLAGQRIARVKMTPADEFWDSVVERGIPDDHG